MTTDQATDRPTPATGPVHTLRRGTAVARIGELAAVLREFSVDGVRYTETWADDRLPPMGCGIVLVPWPNRVADGRWTYRGAAQQLDVTEVSTGHASHGLLRNTAYVTVDFGDDVLEQRADVYPQHGWPGTLQTWVRHELTGDGLAVTHGLINIGSVEVPFGVGAHPYLRVGDVPVDELTVTVAAASYAETDERMIPTGLHPVEGTEHDFRGGARVGDRLGHNHALTDLTPVGDRYEHRVTAPDGRGVVLWADASFGFAQVYVPPNFPGEDGTRTGLAIEPMTCNADALNNGQGLRWLHPGERWTGSWGLTPID
ncbi:aldose 1-epimerase family protein [Nakamurella leprariae]|uniref:Aldose 1-epimerase family protein n=1 Tax=Nakamurella leprariae TaxID=2803911 RepID=A0A939BVC1_9ACTN|nr:aldose 1-epimerase family protein [Nakamurella leprariae]MBM9466373.1 aldose 1-epimerase family protein [Nakamurella leprariae]